MALHLAERAMKRGAGDGLPQGGFQMIAIGTGADMRYPVEILRDDHGTPIAARIEFVDDIAKLDGKEGTWTKVGGLTVTSRELVAIDPYCDGEVYLLRFPFPSGIYVFERFAWKDHKTGSTDTLGFRIRGRQGRLR